ncbi:MAG TPA: DUF3164 family protein [Candidatus Tenderia sp.]|nr:DUF3164 family protein [Candidatus Tenderia sp.]
MRRNAQGHWVEVDNIEDIDLARDDIVMEITAKALKARQQLQQLKAEMMADVQAFIELSADTYGVKLGGKKGNVTLLSFDGQYKVTRQIAEDLSFDERLQAAKALIDECIHTWTSDSSAEIKTLIDHAFQVDKEGNISTGRVLGLRRLKIRDPKWLKAMDAISDSVQIIGTKPYLRVYKRDDSGKFQPISLDIATL